MAKVEVFQVKLGGTATTDEIGRAWRDAGFYTNGCITQTNFPLNPHVIEDATIGIIDPGCPFSAGEGLRFLEVGGLMRPTYEHALRFVEQHGGTMNGNKDKPYIIFLHEPVLVPHGIRHVLYVSRNPDYRRISLCYYGDKFVDLCVLAGVCPRSPR